MNRTTRHISLSVILAAAATLSSCQNQNNGLYGSNNWNRNAYANKVLSQPINPSLLAMNGAQVVGYITPNTTGAARAAYNPNPTAGGISGGGANGTGGISGGGAQPAAGGISGSSLTGNNGCQFKILSVSPANLLYGSTQNYGYGLNEANYPSSGRGVYPTGGSFPISCSGDSEVAATANSFYITSGSTGGYVYIFRMGVNGAFIGSTPIPANGPTKITASPSGHIAFIEDGGRSIRFIKEDSIGGDGSYVAHLIPSIQIMNDEIAKDLVIDNKQGGYYVASEIPGRGRSIKVYPLDAAFQGIFQAYYDSGSAFMNQGMMPQYRDIAYNMDPSVTANIMNNGASPLIIKNFDGLTGVLLSTGKPFFLETQLSRPANEIASAAPAVQQDNQTEREVYYQNLAEDGIVSAIYAYDPYQVNYHPNSPQTQASFKYTDIAVGNNYMYGISQGMLYTCHIAKDDQYSCARPRQLPINSLGTAARIETSYDQTFAMITGSAGLSIAAISGSGIAISPTGRPDISEVGGVIHAATLAKVSGSLTTAPANAYANTAGRSGASLIQP